MRGSREKNYHTITVLVSPFVKVCTKKILWECEGNESLHILSRIERGLGKLTKY